MEVIFFICTMFFFVWFIGLFSDSNSSNDVKNNNTTSSPDVNTKIVVDTMVVKASSRDGKYEAIIKNIGSGKYASITRESKEFTFGDVLKFNQAKIDSFTWRDTIETHKYLTVSHAYRGKGGKHCSIAYNGDRYFKYERSKAGNKFKIGEKFRINIEDYNSNYYSLEQVDQNKEKWTVEYDEYIVCYRLGKLDDKYWTIVEYNDEYTILCNPSDIWSSYEDGYWMPKSLLQEFTYYGLEKCFSISGRAISKKQLENSSKWTKIDDEKYDNFLAQCISNGRAINYDLLREFSISSLREFDSGERDEIFKSLNSGVAVLNNISQTDMYNNSYGNMHKGKLIQAYESLPEINTKGKVTIVDYGCGQGIGTLILLDVLARSINLNKVKNIILIEPSPTALSRSVTTLTSFKAQNKLSFNVISINKYLNDVSSNDIMHTDDLCLHIFSNIIDIPEVDNNHLLKIISESNIFSKMEVFVCVGPKFTTSGSDYRSQKFRSFAANLDGHKISEDFTNIGKWTRQHIVIEK